MMRRPTDRSTDHREGQPEDRPVHSIHDSELSPDELAVALHYTPAPWWFKIFDLAWCGVYAWCFYSLATEPKIRPGTPEMTRGYTLAGVCALGFILISVAQLIYARRSGEPRMRPFEAYRLFGFLVAFGLLTSLFLPGRQDR